MLELGVTAVMLPELALEEQVELCRSLKVKYYQYRPRVIAPQQRKDPYSNWGNHKFDLTPDRLLAEGAALTRRLRDAGLEPWGTLPAVSIDAKDDELKRHLEGAAVAEAKGVRVQPLGYPRQPFNYPDLLKRNVDRYAEVVDRLSGPLRIKLLIETHAGTLATSPGLAWNLCRHFPPQRVGAIFDMANFSREGEVNANLAVSVLRDYVDCVHIGGGRRVVKGADGLGCKVLAQEFCAMEEGDLHIPTWLKALRDAGSQAPLIIEDFTPNTPGAERLKRSAAFLHKVIAKL